MFYQRYWQKLYSYRQLQHEKRLNLHFLLRIHQGYHVQQKHLPCLKHCLGLHGALLLGVQHRYIPEQTSDF